MSNEQNVKEEDTGGEETSNGRAYAIIASVALAVYFLFIFMGKPGMGLTAFLCIATILVAVGICWDLRTRFWFWVVIATVVALHLPLIFLIQWPHHWIPGIALAPIGFIDCMIIVGIVRFVQKHIVKDVPPDENG